MNLDETLQNIIDSLKPFHTKDSIYFSPVNEIIDDCYRLQDRFREDSRDISSMCYASNHATHYYPIQGCTEIKKDNVVLRKDASD